jgi:hypothetical protein
MMKPYSRVLASRATWMGLWMLLFLVGTAWFQQRQAPQKGDTVFIPADRIAQVLAVSQSLASGTAHDPPSQSSPILPCEGRSLAVLRVRLMSGLGLSQQQADERIQLAAKAKDSWAGCSGFMQAFQSAMQLTAQTTEPAGVSALTVTQQFSEDVTWSRTSPCFLGQAGGQTVLLSGNPLNCGPIQSLTTWRALAAGSSYSQLANGVAKAAAMSAVTGKLSRLGPSTFTLDSQWQARFDQWSACLNTPSCTDRPALQNLRDVSVVIMDTSTGAVLAAWCHGKSCAKASGAGPGAIAATLLEAPPASTAKLLFALGFAVQGRVDPEMLQKQIKTSGQNDASVSKRNEWWEKQAICDGSQQRRCDVPAQARSISQAFGFNRQCQANDPNCGRVGLVSSEVSGLVPGLMGRMAIAQDGQGSTKMIEWQRYDNIRQGKQKPEGGSAYTATSQAIQAVIGAGDSRVSALGLAAMPLQIWRLAHDQKPVLPFVMAPASAAGALPSAPTAWTQAAKTVLGGMRQAVEPAQVGWQGAGTISAAFVGEMKKPCIGECGVWGKTGTVSQKDPGFAGTSLFAGLVDTRELARWHGHETASEAAHGVLSIGVIAIPKKGAPPFHAASHVAMAVVSQVLTPSAKP